MQPNNLVTLNRLKNEIALSTNMGLSGKVRTRVLNPDGSVTPWSPWFKNLILNTGMDAPPVQGGWGYMMQSCKRGTDNTPVRRNTSGTGVTLSQSTNTVTASSAFFLSTDVGSIIKYGASGSAGAEAIITGYTDSTHVTVSTSATVSSTDAVVWFVTQTSLVAWVDNTSTTFESDLTTFDATGSGSGIPTFTMRRGFQFAAVVSGPVTYKELGFGWSGGATNLWSRVLVPGSGDTLTTGQIYQVEYSLTIQIPDGAAQQAVGDSSHPTGDPFSTAGIFMVECCDFQANSITYGDNGSALSPFDSSFQQTVCAVTSTWTQRTVISNTPLSSSWGATKINSDSYSQDAYSSGTYQVVRHSTFNLATANVTWYGICVGDPDYNRAAWTIKFTTPIAKNSSHMLAFTHTLSWSRVLTN